MKLELRVLNSGDASTFLAWRQEPTARRFNPLDDLTLGDLAHRLASETNELGDQQKTAFRWVVGENGKDVGSVALTNVAWRMGFGEIGYMITESCHGRGLGTNSVRLLVDKVFAETKLVRLVAIISAENVASCRLVERLGFKREGTLREHFLIQGRRVDENYYGLLRREWTGDV